MSSDDYKCINCEKYAKEVPCEYCGFKLNDHEAKLLAQPTEGEG